MRYTLMICLLLVAFFANTLACIIHSERWVLFNDLKYHGQAAQFADFSDDMSLIATYSENGPIRVFSFPDFKLRWETAPIHTNSYYGTLYFRHDSPEIILATLDLTPDGVYTLARADLATGQVEVQQYRTAADVPDDLNLESAPPPLQPEDPEYRIQEYGPNVQVWRARFPEGWQGHFHRGEVWVALITGLMLLVIFVRSRLKRRSGKQ